MYLVPVSEAAHLAEVPSRTLYHWARKGLVFSKRVGRRKTIYVDYLQLSDLLEGCARGERLSLLRRLT